MNKDQFFEFINGKTIALCGVGRSHMPLAKLFSEKGALITLRDKRSLAELGENGKELERLGVNLVLGDNYMNNLDEDIIFRTPGMKFSLPELQEARKRGKIVTSELEVFFDICPCPIYAITGSDGKTTTTTIISEFLRAEGKTVHLGGNIGKPLLPEIFSINENDVAVAELSSFQLISMHSAPDVAVVTNVSPNHLDWHKDMDEYVEAKTNIFMHQNAFSRTVLNDDDEMTASFKDKVRGDTFMFSRANRVKRGAWVENGTIYVNSEKIIDTSEICLKGNHNVENYLAAISAVYGAVSKENIVKVAKIFNGVEHRMEFVRELEGVKYYNDSIASSPARTEKGTLSFYKDKIILICGGYDKKIPYDSLGPVICDKVKTLILMGQTGGKVEAAVKNSPNYKSEEIEIIHAENMAEAVLSARSRAESGDVVSLSPASASFGMYVDFEERGRHFKKLVGELK